EHIADALQVRAELGGEPDALRLTAGERRRGAVEREVSQPHAVQEPQPRAHLRKQIARDLLLSGIELEPGEEGGRAIDGLSRERGYGAPPEAHVERDRVQALPLAVGALGWLAVIPLVPPDLVPCLFFVEAGHLESGAVAALAPAVLRIEREEPRIELREAAAARRTGSLRGKHRDRFGI